MIGLYGEAASKFVLVKA